MSLSPAAVAAALHAATDVMGVEQVPLVTRPPPGGEGVGGGNAVAPAVLPQIVKPSFVTEPSVYQNIVSPAAIATPLGPLVPAYRIEPMVM